MNIYYNDDLKFKFLGAMAEKEKSYIASYERIFKLSKTMEELLNKDLYSFTNLQVKMMFKSIASNIKHTSALTYNSLIKEYKTWVSDNTNFGVVNEICTNEELKSIDFKDYVIFTKQDINALTSDTILEGNDYLIALFIRLFWETNGQESVKDLLTLNIHDVDTINSTIKIKNSKINTYNSYIVSEWLVSFISYYASLDCIEFSDKGGAIRRNRVLSAEENCGLVFRTTYRSGKKIGEPLSPVRLANMLYQYCVRIEIEVITVNDLAMSLALREMIKFNKLPQQMYSERKYFRNLPTSVYKNVLEKYSYLYIDKSFLLDNYSEKSIKY